jgi:alpha-tubulin suppressor-like RCC1 family protein
MRINWKVSDGYILPATIILGLAISIMAVTFLQFTASTNATLSSETYSTMAEEAARAGLSYADSCVLSGYPSWTTALTPNESCTGTTTTGSAYVSKSPDGDYQTRFSVSAPTVASNFASPEYQTVSTGIVEVLQNNVVVKRVYATKISDYSSTTGNLAQSTGNSVTDFDSESANCAIANGKLYCWGLNSSGQLGIGNTVTQSTPQLVNGHGAITANMVVTKVTIGDNSTCAIANGQAYCWGDDTNYQLGNNSYYPLGSSSPVAVSGSLSGKKVTDISTAPSNTPTGSWGPSTSRHTCALSDGVPYCWGGNEYRQLSGGDSSTCWWGDTIDCYPAYSTPHPVYGYNSGETSSVLYGLKSDRVVSGSHGSCSVSGGQLYCWGIAVPLSCPNGFGYQPAPWGACSQYYSNPYLSAGDNTGKFVDPATLSASTDLVCMMANTNFDCFGKSPGLSFYWTLALNPVTAMVTNTDVTASDNGENYYSDGGNGLTCLVASGIVQCASAVHYGDGYDGTSTGHSSTFTPIVTTSGLAGNIATKIGAGWSGGAFQWIEQACAVANGQLFCWGDTNDGQFGDGTTSEIVPYATPTVPTTGANGIGTASGVAATGPLSVGGSHACGVANGQLYCWGDNTYGQLGSDPTTFSNQYQPLAVPFFVGRDVTKVSAGTNHTCAIADGQLYCWGLNSSGQLGISSTTNQWTPTLVSFGANERVTDVSAGDTGTCAVANGQAYCWGLDTNQQVGDAGSGTPRTSPVKVNGNGALSTSISVTAVTMGTDHACAIGAGSAYCWGDNANGRTGLGVTVGNSSPTKVTGGTAGSPIEGNITPYVSAIDAGNGYTCAVIDSFVSCWGLNSSGQLGDGTAASKSIPTLVNGTAGTLQATALSTGSDNTCADLQGNIYCWGDNLNGKNGNGVDNSGSQLTPTLVNGGDTSGRVTTNVAVGGSSACSISNADILCWGNYHNGRTGNLSAASDVLVPTEASPYHQYVPFVKGPVF